MRTKRSRLAALTAGLLLVVSLAPAAPVAAAPPEAVAAAGLASSHTVTLVTGDRITVSDDGAVMVHRSGARDGVTFLAYRAGGHQYVIPSDALDMVRDGRLDRRLFDVTLLREFGYDDRRGDLPVIVTGNRAPAAVQGAAGQTDLPAIDGLAAQVDKAELDGFWESVTDPAGTTDARTLAAGVSTVWLDGLRQPVLDESVPQVGAPAAHAAGLDGTGATVAVLDTGIDVTHPDLAEQVVASENFTEGEEDDLDRVGHGTHVASTVAGTGAASGGEFRGVAPGADLLNGKVCVDEGCADSWLLAGMQWAAEQGADVVNMSLGGFDTSGLDPVEQAVETLTAEFGTLFVVAAGNDGEFAPVSSPASAPAAVAVGAVDKADQLADFSSLGPTVEGALKPDLTAPGVEITAANSKDGFLGEPGEPYTTLDGTSMATPHVAGAAAILVQQHPEWTPAQLKAALMGSAAPNAELGPYAQGSGRLDVAAAIGQTVTADPPSVGFDRALWPHGDDDPQARTVTYVNSGDAVTLELALDAAGPDGEPAPDGFFALDVTTVTVPAGGSAAVTLAVDTSAGEVDGRFGGYLTATGPDVVVTTAFAVEREVESYDVTLPHTDRAGAPTTDYFTTLIRLDAAGFVDVFLPEAAPTVRVPAGEYALMSFVHSEDVADEVSLLVHPRFVVDGDLTVPVDAREAAPIAVTIPEPTAVPTLGAVMADLVTEESGSSFFVLADDFDGVFTGQLGPDQTLVGLASAVTGAWAKPNPENPDDLFAGTPYTYDLTWFEAGRMMTGFTRDVKPRDLAAIRASHARHVPGVDGWKTSLGILPGVFEGGAAVILPEPAPFRRTEYHNTDGGVYWEKSFEEVFEDVEAEIIESFSYTVALPTAYRAGRTYREQWNQGVFGPALPDCGADVRSFPCLPALSRLGDQLEIAPRLYGDSAGRSGFRPGEHTISVYRDGEQLAEIPDQFATVDVPPGTADYRVEVASASDGRIPLSTSVNLAWTFRSGHVAGEDPLSLPVSVVRFTPRLDQHNSAPAGRPYAIPVEVVGQPGSDAARVKRLTVEVSFDDGESWRRAPVLANRLVLVPHPAEEGFVSLRASATDRAGNTVEQTIIRAYAIG